MRILCILDLLLLVFCFTVLEIIICLLMLLGLDLVKQLIQIV